MKTPTDKTKLSLKAVKLLIALFWIVLATSCADFLRGKPQLQNEIQVSSSELGCLDKLSVDMKQFLNAEATEAQLDNSLVCIQKVLTEFQVRVEGRSEKDSFSTDEVYDIFSTFVPEAQLTRNAAVQMLLLKSAVIGGSKDRITKSEMNHLKSYLAVVKNEAVKLLPYIKIYRMEESQRLFSRDQLKKAYSELNASAKRLLAQSMLSNSEYKFEDFKEAIVNIFNLAEDDKNLAEIFSKLNAILNGTENVLSQTQRDQYVNNLTDFLFLYSLYVHNHVSFDMKNLEQMDSALDFSLEIMALLERSLQYQETRLISSNSIDRFLVALAGGNYFKYPVKASSMIGFYKAFVVRVLESGFAGSISQLTGIKPVNLINARREIAVFQIFSRMIKTLITDRAIEVGSTHYNIKDLQAMMAEIDPQRETEILSRFDDNNKYMIVSIVNELKASFMKSTVQVYHNNKVGVSNNSLGWAQSRDDLARGAFIQTLSRLVMLGYSPTYQVLGVTSSTLDDRALYTWYSEFKALMIDIKSWDPRAFNSGIALRKTANLFTNGGNGNSVVDIRELNEILASQLSTGGVMFNEMFADLEASRCQLPERDVFDNPWHIESCFMQVVRLNYLKYFSHLPALVKYAQNLSAADFNSYFSELLNVARYDIGQIGRKVETSDVTTMNSILQFIEVTYLKYDLNRNTTLSESEIRNSYPAFSAIATEFAETTAKSELDDFASWMGDVGGYGCFDRQDLIRESFIFLIYNGRTPKTDDLNSFPCFTGKPLLNFSGEVSRLQLTKAFKTLGEVIAPR